MVFRLLRNRTGWTRESLFESFDGKGIFQFELTYSASAQGGKMGAGTKCFSDVSCKCSDISAFAAHNPEINFRKSVSCYLKFLNHQWLGFKFGCFSPSGDFICPLSV